MYRERDHTIDQETTMRFVPTRVHGILDWLLGAVLAASPWILGLDASQPEGLVPMGIGIVALILTFFTDHELGVVRRIPMPMHLATDVAAGALLAVSPWLFGFADRVSTPHLVLGIAAVIAGLTTRTVPGDRRATM